MALEPRHVWESRAPDETRAQGWHQASPDKMALLPAIHSPRVRGCGATCRNNLGTTEISRIVATKKNPGRFVLGVR
jgi:hypothetical protein